MPEKTLAEIENDLRELYRKGNAALQRNNLDYAIVFFHQVLQREPSFFECRQALRAAQFKKSGANTSFFKRIVGGASNSPLVAKAQMALRKNPIDAINIAEQILAKDPASVPAHKVLAEAALEADFPKTAVLSLEIAIKHAPKDYNLSMTYGRALAANGQSSKAEAVYQSLMKAHPHKGEINQALKDLSANTTMDEGGYEGAESYRDILKNKEEAQSLEQENRSVRDHDSSASLIQEYEARLAQEPESQKLLRSLAELYSQKAQYDKALEYYHRMQALEGSGDPGLEKAIAETTLRRINAAIAQLDPSAPDHADELARLQSERAEYQLTECKARAERYPTDLGIRFELGELYFKAGKVREAQQEFQKAKGNPAKRIQAITYLAHCLARNGMNDMAARTYQEAIKEMPTFDEKKKDAIYQLGCLLEKMEKMDEAIEQFKLIYEVDIGYKDVADKVERFYSGG